MWPELFSPPQQPGSVQSLLAMLYSDLPKATQDATQNNLGLQAMLHAHLSRYQSSPFADSLAQAIGAKPNISIAPNGGVSDFQRFFSGPLSGYPVGMKTDAAVFGSNMAFDPKALGQGRVYSDEVFSHEMGHVLANENPSVYKGWQTATEDIKAPAGSYAATNPQEGFAEAFKTAILGLRQAQSHDFPPHTAKSALARQELQTPGITYILHYLMSKAPYDRSELSKLLK